MARVLLLDGPGMLNSSGTVVHVCGLAWAGGHGQPAETFAELRDVAAPSGAALAIRRALFRELGGFTEELFMYQEDLVLGWRARLAGLRVVATPAADVLHDYEFGRNAQKSTCSSATGSCSCSPRIRRGCCFARARCSRRLSSRSSSSRSGEGWSREKVRGWAWWCAPHALARPPPPRDAAAAPRARRRGGPATSPR